MKKKILTLAAGLTVLVAGVVTVVKVADKSSSPIKEEKKEVDSAEYEAAFQAVSKAESSNAEEDIQAAQVLVDKLGKKGAALQVRLDDLKSKLAAWKEMDALLVVAETNPTDDAAIQAAKTKYDELMADVATKFYDYEMTYYLRVHGLQYKKADAIVSQAENTLINSDYQTAVDFYNSHLQQYFKNYSIEVKDPQTGEKTWSFLKEHEALLARLNALGVRHQEIATAQAAQAQDQGGYVASGDQGGYVAPSGDGTGGTLPMYGDIWKNDLTYDPSKERTVTLPDGRTVTLYDGMLGVGIFGE